jgi:hypothetical protein
MPIPAAIQSSTGSADEMAVGPLYRGFHTWLQKCRQVVGIVPGRLNRKPQTAVGNWCAADGERVRFTQVRMIEIQEGKLASAMFDAFAFRRQSYRDTASCPLHSLHIVWALSRQTAHRQQGVGISQHTNDTERAQKEAQRRAHRKRLGDENIVEGGKRKEAAHELMGLTPQMVRHHRCHTQDHQDEDAVEA